MKNRFNFFISKVMYINLGIIALVLIVGFVLFNTWLTSYTAHGEKHEVPSFINLDIEEARILAEKQNFTLKIIDTLYSENIRPGAIVDHTPKPGAFIKETRTIFISINSLTPILVAMPKVTDVSLRQATQTLERYGLQIGNIEYKPDFADNYVFEQKYKNRGIRVGTKIPKGTKIDLIVGKGGSDISVLIPDLTGLTTEAALSMASSLGLNTNLVYDNGTYETSADSAQAVVWKQSPIYEEGKTMNSSQKLDIWVMPANKNE